jgi:hypothetical protein
LEIEDGSISIPDKIARHVNTDISPIPFGRFDISKYDAILLSGVGIPAIRKQNDTINRRYVVAGFVENKNEIDRQVVSRGVFSILIEKAINNLPSFVNIARVSSIFNKNIYVQPFPLPTPIVLDQSDFDLRCYGRNVGAFLSWYYTKQISAIESSINNKNVFIVNYPQNWLDEGFTPISYRSIDDAWHMNKDFGAYFMREILGTVL